MAFIPLLLTTATTAWFDNAFGVINACLSSLVRQGTPVFIARDKGF